MLKIKIEGSVNHTSSHNRVYSAIPDICSNMRTYANHYWNNFSLYANNKDAYHTGACELLQSVDRLCCSFLERFTEKQVLYLKKNQSST